MNARFSWILSAATLGVAAVCVAVAVNIGKPASSPSRPSLPTLEVPQFTQPLREIDTSVFIEDERVNTVWISASSSARAIKGKTIAGIVNHHALAADLIASFFANLRVSRPDLHRIVVISPDHYKVGRDEVSTHTRPYRAGSSLVRIDKETVDHLVKTGVATEEDGVLFEREHGIGALAPFIARAYPDANIVPIAFRGDLSSEHSKRLAESLKELWDEKTILIISADMSHYLAEDVALKNDETTLWLLKAKDEAIASSTDDFIDSGKSVATLFAAMNEVYPNAVFVPFAHSISSRYGGDPSYTTSYFTGVWSVDQ
jgi:AmmeMemoRadiSam system protein B